MDLRLQNCVGYKLFKENEDNIEILRIMHVKKYKQGNPAEITVRDESTKEVKKIRVDSLKDYTPLLPDGYLTFNIVQLKDSKGKIYKDVVVTASKMLNIQIGDMFPFAICRQSITDVFYNLLCRDESDMITGLAINQNTCPSNFDFKIMLACDKIEYSENVSFYRSDILSDLLSFINEEKFDNVLELLYMEHVNAVKNPTLVFNSEHKGWCRKLKILLKENNFQNDIRFSFKEKITRKRKRRIHYLRR